jgi:hypothetical protein
VAATITCGMIVVGPLFYAMYVELPTIMVSFSIVPPKQDKGARLRFG